MSKHYRFLIGNEWRSSGENLEVRNPFNDEMVGVIDQPTEEDVEDAIRSAEVAFDVTKRLSSIARSEILAAITEGLVRRKEELACFLTAEIGKTINEARGEVGKTINVFALATEEAKRTGGEFLPLDLTKGSENRWAITRRFPLGLILGIIPFNFPLLLAAHKLAPALAVGNTMLLKPPLQAPLTIVLLGEIALKSGLPAGALSILPCPNPLAERMAADDRIKMLSFTGGAQVGWYLKSKAGKKRVTLELGGNAGVIVHSDGDIGYAAQQCVVGGFSCAGQICISVQRVYVQQTAYREFLDSFVDLTKKLKVGDPREEDTDVGPMIDLAAAERAEKWVQEAVSGGAEILIGGKRRGTLFEPTILIDTTPQMKVNCQEIFAPVATVTPYEEFEEAVRLVNDSPYGLRAGVFTKDVKRIFFAYEELEVGGVVANDTCRYRADHTPYGGMKDSGLGREGVKYAMEEMTQIKDLALNLS